MEALACVWGPSGEKYLALELGKVGNKVRVLRVFVSRRGSCRSEVIEINERTWSMTRARLCIAGPSRVLDWILKRIERVCPEALAPALEGEEQRSNGSGGGADY